MRATGWLFVLVAIFAGSCSKTPDKIAREALPSRAEIWAAIQPQARRYEISPAFVYALVAAESNFDPRARNGDACGLMQIKPDAWRTVSAAAYEPAVWQWRTNLEAGIDYLAYSRSYLHRKTTFSYPLLLAAFHYGLDYVEDRNFDVQKIPVPDNPIYQKLWSGKVFTGMAKRHVSGRDGFGWGCACEGPTVD